MFECFADKVELSHDVRRQTGLSKLIVLNCEFGRSRTHRPSRLVTKPYAKPSTTLRNLCLYLSGSGLLIEQLQLEHHSIQVREELISSCQVAENQYSKERFGTPIPEADIASKSRKSFSKATEKKCYWAMKIFNWKAWRNERAVQGSTSDMHLSPIRVELLEMTKDELCFSLTRFVSEAKKQNRDPYPAEILYEIVISIQMYLWMNGQDMKFLNDEEFTVLKNTLDTRMKELRTSCSSSTG
ncbi:uncharacterized protein LOC110981782 [Acanthaster planci]|uniref:Uncharacterized protein LOC110981782 n=1 Tax=Acanthaster planci TaxID=133434 RepID=A0A8B7YQ11_ACAPL|nr:uncharacterized protein LOC110981782 [Acanthaster planci]